MVIAIIDHKEHQLFIENINDAELEIRYNGSEEAYIMDKYRFNDEDLFSWEYLVHRVEVFGEKKNGKINIHSN